MKKWSFLSAKHYLINGRFVANALKNQGVSLHEMYIYFCLGTYYNKSNILAAASKIATQKFHSHTSHIIHDVAIFVGIQKAT